MNEWIFIWENVRYLRLKCTKFDFDGGAYSAPQTP